MSNMLSSKRYPRVLFFGMSGTFSLPSLTSLLESSIEVCAVVLPATSLPGRDTPALRLYEQPAFARRALPLANAHATLQASIAQLAWSRHIPVWEVYRLTDPVTQATLAAYKPDILCVACFSQRIPRSILALPRLGSINVHPSLLPKNRGPVPLFWTFRNGDAATGVTIHRLEEGMDSGAILAQEALTVPDGIGYAELEDQCATRGGTLLAQTVWKLYEGSVADYPQDESQSSYYSFPTAQDFVVPVREWDARHVYNFIRGVGHWEQPVQLFTEQGIFPVRDVISYSHKNRKDIQEDQRRQVHAEGAEEMGREDIMRRRMVVCRNGTVIVMIAVE